MEDAIALNLVTERQWNLEVRDLISDHLANYPLRDRISKISSDLFSEVHRIRKESIGLLVDYFIGSCALHQQSLFSHHLFDLKVVMDSATAAELKILKEFVVNNVVKTVEVQTLEYKGQQMIVRLFEAIANNPSRLLLKKYYKKYVDSDNDSRVICDYLAGTTDDYATRLYHKIFTPSSGSIFDRL